MVLATYFSVSSFLQPAWRKFRIAYAYRTVYGVGKSSCVPHTNKQPIHLYCKRNRTVHTTATQMRWGEDRSTKALALWEDFRQIKSSPVPALVYGFSGLIPFAAAPLYMFSAGSFIPHLAVAQVGYGACILSFLGGVRWGLTLPDDSVVRPSMFNLGCSVTPSLIAWAGLLVPPSVGCVLVIIGLALSAYLDLTLYGYPKWFKALRFCLTFGAILSLWTVFMCRWLLPTEPSDREKAAAKLKQE